MKIIVTLALGMLLGASASPALANQGYDIGRYFTKLEDRIKDVLDGQKDITRQLQKLEDKKCR